MKCALVTRKDNGQFLQLKKFESTAHWFIRLKIFYTVFYVLKYKEVSTTF